MNWIAAYLSTIYGTILFIAVSLALEKDKYDDSDQHFSLKKYARKTWDNWLVAILAIPLVAHWGPDLTSLVYPSLEWSSLGYGLSGFLVKAAYWKLKKHYAKE